MWARWIGAVAVLLCLGAPAPGLGRAGPSQQTSSCSDACYQAKSLAYQRCRTIPPGDREARVACFQRADEALQRCLRACK